MGKAKEGNRCIEVYTFGETKHRKSASKNLKL
jgi:hypothetical protein